MEQVIGVKFKRMGKTYYFSPNGTNPKVGDNVIVETARGIEYGRVSMSIKNVEENEIVSPLKPIIRLATAEDDARLEENQKKQKEAFALCEEKIAKHNLEMKLVDVEYTFDCNKILFYFTSDRRVDFRELVKDLAGVFRTRIELRQIGVRDEAKMLGGLGVCGRNLCCVQYLDDFQPVSIKMAKEQGLSLNPSKISGNCGRLMCCLKYEQDCYEELLKIMPRAGAIVSTPDGKGSVVSVSLLKEKVKVLLNGNEGNVEEYSVNDIKIIRDGKRQKDENSEFSEKELRELQD
jgi:cell fate regulator YaaT (PSP1 superfamily)